MVYIICGVSGTGKTKIGTMLADHLGIPFYDADDYHSEDNVRKMAGGIPLNDDDRSTWLALLSSKIQEWEQDRGAVLACSALKEVYREKLSIGKNYIRWVVLEGSKELILQRMKERKGHYFSANMLDSQLAIYERPAYGLVLDVQFAPMNLVDSILSAEEKDRPN